MKITIRDLLWLTTVVALAIGFYYSWRNADELLTSHQILLVELTANRAEMKLQGSSHEQDIAKLRTQIRDLQTENKTLVVANFFFNRGISLYDLDRLEESAAAFEIAHRNVPDNLAVIDYLIRINDQVGKEKFVERYRAMRKQKSGLKPLTDTGGL